MKKNLIVTILLLIGIVVVEYLVWSKVVEPKKVQDYDLKKAKELVDKFYTDDYIVSSNVFKDGMTEKYMMSMSFNEAKSKLKEVECSELYADKTKDSDGIIVNDGAYCDGKTNTIKYEDLEKSYKDLFGKKSVLVKRTIGIFDYIEDKNIFAYLSCRCGGADTKKYIYDVKDAKLKGSNLTINVYYYEYEPEEGEEEIDTKKFISENKDKMSTYKMSFKKENGKFKLLEVKKVS